jgi:sugar phosphate isomerase/epimerase
VHPRVSMNSMSTARFTLDEDLAFYARHGYDQVTLSYGKFEASGVARAIEAVNAADVRVDMLFGMGRVQLADPSQWDDYRATFVEIVDSAKAIDSATVMVTTGVAGPLTWEEAADALEAALAPGLEYARAQNMPVMFEHTNSLRVDVGFVHTLRDMIDVATRLDAKVLMEVNACWAERNLAGTWIASVSYRSATSRSVRATRRTGWCPATATSRSSV